MLLEKRPKVLHTKSVQFAMWNMNMSVDTRVKLQREAYNSHGITENSFQHDGGLSILFSCALIYSVKQCSHLCKCPILFKKKNLPLNR